jgi:hypothetical protein
MTNTSKNFQNLGIAILVLAAFIVVANFIAPVFRPAEEIPTETGSNTFGLSFLFMGVGALAVLGVCYATRNNPAWEIPAQKIVYIVMGSIVFGIVAWLFNGATFKMPTLSQVGFYPAVVVPILFGYFFGPAVGLMVGAGGTLVGGLFIGSVSPHWIMAYGLVGFFAGVSQLFEDKRQSWDVAAVIIGIGAIMAGAFFLANPGTPYSGSTEPNFPGLSLFLGLSVVVGCALAIAVRFAFPNQPQWAEAAVWGAAGIVVSLFLAAMADIVVNQSPFIDTVVGRYIPTAGPALIAAAILVPLVLAIYKAAQDSEMAKS